MPQRWGPFLLALLAWAVGALAVAPAAGKSPRRIVFLAGRASHGYGTHEYYGGFRYLADVLNESAPGVTATVQKGWPDDPSVLRGADAVVIGSDAGKLITQNLEGVRKLAEDGAGIACFHYTLVVPEGECGEAMLDAVGGYYETYWSVNPIWTADFTGLPDHPVAGGVEPFTIRDEWYYHMRFAGEMRGVTPVLTAVPPDGTRKGPTGPHSGNPHVRARMGEPEHVAWVFERPGGGRGFGLTGMHWHWNWAHDDYRTLVLNALVWIAGAEVPEEGVPSETPALEDLQRYLDRPPPENWSREAVERMIRRFPSGRKNPH